MKKSLLGVVTAAKLWLKYLIAIIRSLGLILWQLHKFGHAPVGPTAWPPSGDCASRCRGVSLKTGNGKKVRSCYLETRSTYNVRSYNTTVIGGYHVESKLVHISLHNVSSFSVTRDLTLNIAQLSPSLLHLPRSEAYFMFVTPAMVMSDGQAPGADHWPRVPADSGHHNINPGQWDNST